MNLFIDIQPSRILPRVLMALWILLTTSFVLFVTSHYSLSTSLILIPLLIVVMAPFAFWQLRSFYRLNRGIKQLQFVDGCWYLVLQDGADTSKLPIELSDNNVLWPWWIRLNYKLEQDDVEQPFMSRLTPQKKQLLICRDAVSETDFRHLSRVLRFYRKEDVSAISQD